MARFKTDIPTLIQWLNKRATSLKAERLPHEPIWQALRRNLEPQLGRPLNSEKTRTADAQAPLEDDDIINTHPRHAVNRMASGMQGGITSPSRQWFRLTIDNAMLKDRTDVKEWLDIAEKAIAGAFSNSNFYASSHKTYLHLGVFGTAAMVIADTEDSPHYKLLDAGSYWFAVDSRNKIHCLLRCFQYTAEQILLEFGKAAVDEDEVIKKQIEDGKNETEFTVWNYIYPNNGKIADIPKERKYLSVYWRDGASQSVLDIRSFSYKPIVAPRWSEIEGPYGYGPGHLALSDCKELQKLEEDKLEAVAVAIRPPVTVPEDMAGLPINNYPGGVTPRKDGGMSPDSKNAILPLYNVRPDLNAMRETIMQVEQRIDKAFFTDLFAMMLALSARPKQMTAREVNELAQEKMSLLGPVLSNMDIGFLDPVVDATMQILLENGTIPRPPEVLQGVEYKTRYVSVLHTEMQATSAMGSMIKLLDFAAIMAQLKPDVADKIDADQGIDEAAQALDCPATFILDDEKVAALRQARAEQQQAMINQEQLLKAAPGLARGAKDLSQTPTNDEDSALNQVTEAFNQ